MVIKREREMRRAQNVNNDYSMHHQKSFSMFMKRLSFNDLPIALPHSPTRKKKTNNTKNIFDFYLVMENCSDFTFPSGHIGYYIDSIKAFTDNAFLL